MQKNTIKIIYLNQLIVEVTQLITNLIYTNSCQYHQSQYIQNVVLKNDHKCLLNVYLN